jgi:hypothetical protein
MEGAEVLVPHPRGSRHRGCAPAQEPLLHIKVLRKCQREGTKRQLFVSQLQGPPEDGTTPPHGWGQWHKWGLLSLDTRSIVVLDLSPGPLSLCLWQKLGAPNSQVQHGQSGGEAWAVSQALNCP